MARMPEIKVRITPDYEPLIRLFRTVESHLRKICDGIAALQHALELLTQVSDEGTENDQD